MNSLQFFRKISQYALKTLYQIFSILKNLKVKKLVPIYRAKLSLTTTAHTFGRICYQWIEQRCVKKFSKTGSFRRDEAQKSVFLTASEYFRWLSMPMGGVYTQRHWMESVGWWYDPFILKKVKQIGHLYFKRIFFPE